MAIQTAILFPRSCLDWPPTVARTFYEKRTHFLFMLHDIRNIEPFVSVLFR